ncbi:hypothetical protein Mpop_0072 [Methylorubrum populi BJ001]|uniref:Uncharacterized protein n=2 Tax=Methylorubrum populi TaxID=223967 RepID=B1ZF20_METPB|nr:hypothetical protein Mpop_0072 [Methylorubrum populi BJ001]PZP66395.1 MAG: hypothetical protein DI590_24005 [Methylorubrum populi]
MRGGYTYSEPPPGAVTCRTCGRMNIGISRAEAERRVAEANAARRPGTPRPPIDVAYFRCCVRPRLRPARLGDIPDGSTFGAVLCEGADEG